MSQWNLNSPPSWAPNAVATERGWEDPDTGEVYVSIRNLVTKGGAGDVASVKWVQAALVSSGAIGVEVKFNERVDVTAGASIVVTNSGSGGNKTLYAAAQSNVQKVLFNKQNDNTTNESVAANAAATGTLTSDGTNVADGATVTIGSKVYTFQATLTNVDGNVKIGADADGSLSNLRHAINLTGTPGTDYAAAMTIHPTVSATHPTGTTLVATAKSKGTGGNSIASTETSTHLSWGGATLSGGTTVSGTFSVGSQTIGGTIVDAAGKVAATGTLTVTANPADTETVVIDGKTYTFKTTLTNTNGYVKIGASKEESMDNLAAAINLTGTPGTDYATATTIHPTVSAKAPDNTLVVTAKTKGTGGNSLATTETLSNGSWGGATLSGGAATATTKTVSAPIASAAGTRVADA